MIETKRLILKPYEVGNAKSFFEQMQFNKEYLADYFPNMLKATLSLENVEVYLEQKSIQWSENTAYSFGIFLKEEGEFIGHISVRGIDWFVPKGEVAYFIFKNHAEQNFATEALEGFKNWCFKKKKFGRLFMKIDTFNIASIKVAEKCGFRLEGTLSKDYRKREKVLIDMHLYGAVKPFDLLRTDSYNEDFHKLIVSLDKYLWEKYGAMQSFYTQFNKVDDIKNVVIAYQNGEPVGCGSFKKYDENTVEIKRMFLVEALRGSGIAFEILSELEYWALEMNYSNCVLETALKQPEAIGFYKKCGYQLIENYGQYIGVENSICMKKILL